MRSSPQVNGIVERLRETATWAKAGTIITCENGHHIGTFKQDIHSGDVMRTDQIDWAIAPPKHLSERCPMCGARYVKSRATETDEPHRPWWRKLLGPAGWSPQYIAWMALRNAGTIHTPEGWQ